ncbi:MAG: glycoside hydrolase family 57 protein [Candidatus Omnitrophica bacterium]|nr:glycoside hydrolase family 57 protein [Candidatus Omnitrophota bacterium]
MLNLAFIFHMHQPYYKDLLTQEAPLPWVRLHGAKDYLDMVQILEEYPRIHKTFNVVPSLLEQVEDYASARVKDKYLELSYQAARDLGPADKTFILNNFFSINKDRVISLFPRYYELYFKKQRHQEFNTQDYLDLQTWFNLAWIDPSFRLKFPELKALVAKGRFFTEEEKRVVLDKQLIILKDIIPNYNKFRASGQIELSVTPYYHPILPLLCSTNSAKEANRQSLLPNQEFRYPQDAQAQIDSGVAFYQEKFKAAPLGMWPSEESVSEQILPAIIASGIKWIVTDETLLFKSLKSKKRDTRLLYQPHLLKRREGELKIVFRDRNLSDLIGFTYHSWKAENAVADFISHLENINKTFQNEDSLVVIAMDGENAWEYYTNDGHDFLSLLYARLSAADFIKTTTVSEYLETHRIKSEIKHLSAGSWIYGNFNKWMNNPCKACAWDWLLAARKELDNPDLGLANEKLALAWKQIYILEGSDWFWWYGEDPDGAFDRLFRRHLSNFYTLIAKNPPDYLKNPLSP